MSVLLNVLLIDDSRSVNLFNRSLLEGMKFTRTIKTCDGGDNAIQYFKNNIDDELFLDLVFLEPEYAEKKRRSCFE